MSKRDNITDFSALLLNAVPLLDVRAPVEYQRGAFPCAVNLPLMNDDERHLVGIEYKNAGQEKAIELGAKLIPPDERERRVAQWLSFTEANPNGALYCFRGGLRSRITQQWLADAGCDYPLVTGGYKALRTFIMVRLSELCEQLPFTLIGGRTGSGKTILINRLPHSIDLEGLAQHRGSSFGRLATPQPSNIDFENAFCVELMRLAQINSTAVYLEDEARMIGSVCIPEPLRGSMQQAKVVVLETPLNERIQHVIDDYVIDLLARYQQQLGEEAGFEAFAQYHQGALLRVRKRFGDEQYQYALSLLRSALQSHQNNNDLSDYHGFIELLLTRYYDPMYDYQTQAKQRRVAFRGNADAVLEWVVSQSQT